MKLEFKSDAYIFGKLHHKGDIVEVPDTFQTPKEYEGVFVEEPKKARKPKDDKADE
jgi:hypothetical protein